AALHIPGADLARDLRRRALRRAQAPGDPRRAASRRGGGGQRAVVPGDRDLGAAVGPDRLVQPARGSGPRATSGVLRVPDRWPDRLGPVPRGGPADGGGGGGG